MKIVVCIRQSANGEINPFDACAYEAALQISGAEVILLSMGPDKTEEFLRGMTRLGAKKAVLLSDPAFAGADTLATAYTLSIAIKKLQPDIVFCGRQTVDGDTGQVSPEISAITGYPLIPYVMEITKCNDSKIICKNRFGEIIASQYPAVVMLERINSLRLPGLFSKTTEIVIWNSVDINADLSRCGKQGSPTAVVKTFQNEQDRRKCTYIQPSQFQKIVKKSIETSVKQEPYQKELISKLQNVWIIGEAPRNAAQTVSDDITMIPLDSAVKIAEQISKFKPDVVLWGSDYKSKITAPQVAALLNTGLCADCTALETDGIQLFMYRPAFSGNIIAKIKCSTRPQMATARTVQSENADIIIGIGYGAREYLEESKAFAKSIGADIAASRLIVDSGFLPYKMQVGLTGKSVSPKIYVALGISGAIHHIAGIKNSATVIAINNDKNAPIFDYADYGIVADIDSVFKQLL